MRFRLKAFGLHLSGSATALGLLLGTLWFGWYQWPGWYLSSALHIVGIVVMVDLVIGPTMTLVVASPGKRRSALARDIAIIVAVQLIALGYGAYTLWGGRPLYYTFSMDRLEMVQASDLKAQDIATGRRVNPALAPWWYNRPRWVWAPLPDDPKEAASIVTSAITGGPDIIQMPRYFQPWEAGAAQLRARLVRVEDMKFFNGRQRQLLAKRMSELGLKPDAANTMVMWGGGRRLLAVFDSGSVQVRALLAAD
jgi:hypothetical protein